MNQTLQHLIPSVQAYYEFTHTVFWQGTYKRDNCVQIKPERISDPVIKKILATVVPGPYKMCGAKSEV